MSTAKNMKALGKYKIGLAIIGLFSAVLFVTVIVQASSTKQDKQIFERADKVATKLDDYVSTKGVPDSLADAGITNPPKEVRYQKINNNKYKFCVTYKAKSSGFNGSETWANLVFGDTYSSDYSDSGSDQYYLYLDSQHHKGENCQTITSSYQDSSSYDQSSLDQTDASSSSSSSYTTNSDGTYTVCGVHADYYEFEGHLKQDITPAQTSVSVMESYPYAGYSVSAFVSPSSQYFSSSCKPLAATDFHNGDFVDVFDIASPNTQAVTIFYKRQ